MKPLVLVTADIKSVDGFNWHAAIDIYMRALTRVANTVPVIVPSLADETELDTLLEHADGVLVTGARTNVHPNHYGEEETEAHAPFDPIRDATTLPLIRATLKQGIPLLTICRGIQELNVALGGSLHTEVQNLEGRIDHRAVEDPSHDIKFKIKHSVIPEKNGVLESIVGIEPIMVNSLHRQAIKDLANNLQIEAKAEDGTIEAVSFKSASKFALGLQWHPEYWAESDYVSRKIFEHFGTAARNFLASKNSIGQAAE